MLFLKFLKLNKRKIMRQGSFAVDVNPKRILLGTDN